MPRSNPVNRAVHDFQRGIETAVIGFAYGIVVEELLKASLGQWVPALLISGALFLLGILSTAKTITDQNHWFVIGIVFITYFLDPLSLGLGVILFLFGYLLRRYYLSD